MRRWAVVAVVLGVLIGLPPALAARPTAARPVTAQALLTKVLASSAIPWSGYVVARGGVPLPDVPQLTQVTALLGGTTRLRVWWASGQSNRVDSVQTGGEVDAYERDGATLRWSSFDGSASVYPDPPFRLPQPQDLVPASLARRLLAHAAGAPTLRLGTGPAVRVAGRPTDTLTVTDTDPDGLVGMVTVRTDRVSGLPLEVTVSARANPAQPLLTSRVLDLSRGAPDPAALRPGLAPGSAVSGDGQVDLATEVNQFAPYRLPDTLAGLDRLPVEGVTGAASYVRGLTLLAVLPLPDRDTRRLRRQLSGVAAAVTVLGTDALQLATPLASVLLVASPRGRGYLLAGSVTTDELQAAATQLLADPPPRTDR